MNKKVLCLLLGILLLFSSVPFSSASEPTDRDLIEQYAIPDNWARPALLFAVRKGLLTGKTGGLLCPEDLITRAEVAAVMERIVHSGVKGDLSSFTDADPAAWYYEPLSRAFAAGIISGMGNGTIAPLANITREQAFSVIARFIGVTGGCYEEINDFADGDAVSSWAKNSLAAMVHAGYVRGSSGKLNPKSFITRQEFAQVIFGIFSEIGSVIPSPFSGTVAYCGDELTPGTVIDGDVVFCSGASRISLDRVTVSGRMVIQGSGNAEVNMTGCNIGTLCLCRNADVRGEKPVPHIVVRECSAIRCDCGSLELWADTDFYGAAECAAVAEGKLNLQPGASVKKTFSASDYRNAQEIIRVRIQGRTMADTILYASHFYDEETGKNNFDNPICSLPKGTQFTYLSRYGEAAYVLVNGQKGAVRKNEIFIMNEQYFDVKYSTDTDYSAAIKETYLNFINPPASASAYSVWINRWTTKVNVFSEASGAWRLCRVCDCALGKITTPTAEGIRSVTRKQRRYEADGFWYQYVTWMGSGYAMHSRLYNYDGTFYDDSINSGVSHGCIRLYDNDAEWIYDNIPIETQVLIY